MTHLEITNFEVLSDKKVNVIAQYLPLGKWSAKPCFVLTLNTSDGNMLVLNLNSKKAGKIIVDTLDKLIHQSQKHKDRIHLCVNEI